MQKIINQLLQNGLRDFEGATISGSIPIREEAINQLLLEFLRDFAHPASPTASPSTASQNASPQLPIQQLAQHVKNLSVKTEDGRLTLQFHIEVTG